MATNYKVNGVDLDQIFSSGGGGAMPVNSILPLNAVQGLITAENAQVWLQSGTIETDVTVYPDATVSYGNFVGTAPTVEVISQFSRVGGVTSDDTTLYVTGCYSTTLTTDRMCRYDITTGLRIATHSLAGISGKSTASCSEGSYIYVKNPGQNAIRRFNKSNGSGGTNIISYASQVVSGDVTGLEFDGTHILVLNTQQSVVAKVHKYLPSGTFVESIDLPQELFSTSNLNSLLYVPHDGIFIIDRWLLDLNFNLIGTLDGDMYWDGALSANQSIAYTVQGETTTNLLQRAIGSYVGMRTAKTDSDSGLPIYTRVK